MRFVETPVFTTQIRRLLSDDSYRALQIALLLRPEQGPLIRGSNGLRKVRWAGSGRGKRGGIRVTYYWDRPTETVYMLFAYSKGEREDLTLTQIRVLARIVREEFR